ncbi:MAG: BlaI/MecI/CopY family transcriptional regulator [Candidatus Latescibacteria bacterium]|nr:BlaI/MecI/CopY family transcriptional regulator [Candidatus Latescibacterota bacterium]
MARKKSPTLTEAELRLMDVLWNKGEATVGDVVEALARTQALAYSTVLTTMRILEQKGYIRHRKEGRAFIYAPVVDRNAAQLSAVRHLMSRFFNNSPESLVLNILENEQLDSGELQRLQDMIEAEKD